MRAHIDIEQAIDRYGNTVFRVCVLYFSTQADVQDAFQDTFLKYSLKEDYFTDENHKKAWLIRVATNICKDMLKKAHRKHVPLEEKLVASIKDESAQNDSSHMELIEAMKSLPPQMRDAVYLSVYEGFSAQEIADMSDVPVNTVYSWISRGKERLREMLS